jgi:hypothetical protein
MPLRERRKRSRGGASKTVRRAGRPRREYKQEKVVAYVDPDVAKRIRTAAKAAGLPSMSSLIGFVLAREFMGEKRRRRAFADALEWVLENHDDTFRRLAE